MAGLEIERPSAAAWWRARRSDVEVRFTGKLAPTRERAVVLARERPVHPPALAWAKQVHAGTTLPATPGACGEGDALVTAHRGLALAISTADCVPVLLAGDEEVAAVHAGWRGIAARIVASALATLRTPRARVTAWIGPAIGPCCYEVGAEVAREVVASSADEALVPSSAGEKPRLDLQRAVAAQLRLLGVQSIEVLPLCTRCHPELLWSYRRDGRRAERNFAFIWRD